VTDPPLLSVIDDDSSLRLALSGLLRSHGYRVEAFGSVEAFLASPASTASCCVLSDIQIPGGMSGIDLKANTAKPVILMTAFGSDSVRARARQVGAVCLLEKPFTDRELIDCLGRAGA
jgi:FixJ family two-component response regulator